MRAVLPDKVTQISDTAMCLSFSAFLDTILIRDSPVPVLTQGLEFAAVGRRADRSRMIFDPSPGVRIL